MTLSELLPELRALPRADKLRVIEMMAADVAREEGIQLTAADKAYAVWSPYDAFGGAAALLRVLNEQEAAK
jgi:hypothetical protein